MLRQRVLTAAVVLPSLLILVIFSSHLVWAALTIILISICAKEWCSISGLTEFKKKLFYSFACACECSSSSLFKYASVLPLVKRNLGKYCFFHYIDFGSINNIGDIL